MADKSVKIRDPIPDARFRTGARLSECLLREMKNKHGNPWARCLPVRQGCLVFRKDHQRQYTYFRNFLSVNLFQNWKKNSKTRIWRYEPFVKLSTIYLSKDIVCRSEFSSFLSWFISTPDSKQKIMAMHMDNAHQ